MIFNRTEIQKIIAYYHSLLARFVEPYPDRMVQTLQRILNLTTKDIKKASDQEISNLNKIVAAVRDKGRFELSKEFLQYAHKWLDTQPNTPTEIQTQKMQDDYAQLSKLDLSPAWVLERLLSMRDAQNHLDLIYDFFNRLPESQNKTTKSEVASLLAKSGQVEKLHSVCQTHNIKLKTWDIENLVCQPVITGSDEKLADLLVEFMTEDKELAHTLMRNGSRNISDWEYRARCEFEHALRSWFYLKTLPYQNEQTKQRVLRLASDYVFGMLSQYEDDKFWLTSQFQQKYYGYGNTTCTNMDLMEDYKHFLINKLTDKNWVETDPHRRYSPANAHSNVLDYLFNITRDTIGRDLLIEHPELADSYLKLCYQEFASGPNNHAQLSADQVQDILYLFSPVLTDHTNAQAAKRAKNLAEDLLGIFITCGDPAKTLSALSSYYQNHPKENFALQNFIKALPPDTNSRVFAHLSPDEKKLWSEIISNISEPFYMMELCAEQNPDTISDLLKIDEKLEETSTTYLSQTRHYEKLNLYITALMNLPDNSSAKDLVVQRLSKLADIDYPPKEHITFEKALIEPISTSAIISTPQAKQHKVLDWLFKHGFISAQDMFAHSSIYLDKFPEDAALHGMILLTHTPQKNEDIPERLLFEAQETLSKYLKNSGRLSKNPEDLLSIQSLLSVLSSFDFASIPSTFYRPRYIEIFSDFAEQILLKAYNEQKKDPELTPLIQAAIKNMEKAPLVDYNKLWPLLSQSISAKDKPHYLLSILDQNIQAFPTLLPDILKQSPSQQTRDGKKYSPKDFFALVWRKLDGQEASVQKDIIDQIPFKDYFTEAELLTTKKFPPVKTDAVETSCATIFLCDTILKNSSNEPSTKKAVLAYLNSYFKKNPITSSTGALMHLLPVIKTLTLGKICTKEELLALSPSIKAAYKIMRHDPNAVSYLAHHYTPEQILNDDLYYRVFSTLVKYKRKEQEDTPRSNTEEVNKHHLAELADRIKHILGKDYVGFCDTISKFGKIETFCDIFPTDGAQWSEQDKDSLRAFLANNLVYATRGKKYLRDVKELRQICSVWPRMTEKERSGRYQDVLKHASVKSYDDVRYLDFAVEAQMCGVPPYLYKETENLFEAAQYVPTPFDTQPLFIAEDPKYGRLVGRFLSRSDPRAFSFGAHTDCCQRWSAAGQECAISSMLDPFSQVFAIENEHGQLIAGSWIWRTEEDQNYGVCFDNVETKGGYKNSPLLNKIYEQAAKYLCKEGASVINVGGRFNDMDVSSYQKSAALLRLSNYNGYTDADAEQRTLVTAESPPNVPDKRAPFFIRPGAVSSFFKDIIPERMLPDIDQSSPETLQLLVDKNGHFQGVSFVDPVQKTASFFANPLFTREYPKALATFWHTFQKQTANYPVKNWAIKIPNSMRSFFEMLKTKKRVSFDTIETNQPTIMTVEPPKKMDQKLQQTEKKD